MHRLRRRRAFAATHGDGSLSARGRAPRPAGRSVRPRRRRSACGWVRRRRAGGTRGPSPTTRCDASSTAAGVIRGTPGRERTARASAGAGAATGTRRRRVGDACAPSRKVSGSRPAYVPRMGRLVLCHSVYAAPAERSSRSSPIRTTPRRDARATVMHIPAERRRRSDDVDPRRAREGERPIPRPRSSNRRLWSGGCAAVHPVRTSRRLQAPTMLQACRSLRRAPVSAPAPPCLRRRGAP